MNKMKIGVIGVGIMGQGIASNLLKHGHTLVLLEHAGNQPIGGLVAAGAKTALSASELAAQVDIVLLCVTGSPQVEAVLLGEHGVLKTLRAGSVVIDCSTAVPTSTEMLAKKVSDCGAFFLDAPMTRTSKEAAEGRLNLLVGGDPEVFARCKPILECFAENIVHAGPVGAGHRMKLLHNFVALGMVSVLSEAAACARKAGIDTQTFVDVLAKGGGAGVPLERLKPYLLNNDPTGLKFTIVNAQKDLSYYNTMAADGASDHTIADAVRRTLDAAVSAGHGDALVPELIAIISGRSS
jgi:3-hydroxyisobutyrate dehydrogenase-like beta-hydroxyacid dehydrogenase